MALMANGHDISETNKIKNQVNATNLNFESTRNSLVGIANLFENWITEESKQRRLLKSLHYLELADQLSEKTNYRYTNQVDKLNFYKANSETFESAIRICLKLYDETENIKYKLLASQYSEKSKSRVLKEALNSVSAKRFIKISSDVIRLQSEIKTYQNYYHGLIRNEEAKLTEYDTLRVRNWKDKLYKLNRQSDSLILALEKNYPRYHELKYQNKILSVEETQNELKDHEALLEYFVGEEQTYLFALTKDSYEVYTINQDSSRQNQIIDFRKNLQASIMGDQASMKTYTQQAYKIYQDLLDPALSNLDSSINKLIIIPDADLGYIPFDVLISEDMEGKDLDYRTLPYLLRDYETQYGYSASLLFNDFKQKEKKFDQQFLAFAPQYEDLDVDSVRGLSLGRFRDQVTSLKYNTPEVNRINEYMDGLTFTGSEAREEAFKNYAGNSSILHLAMHALVDDENPMNSKLVFTQSNDTIEDNFLHAYELYNMELPADMAVLSACETGFGKLEKGEGIMSLARAFSYAGCPSVVMSHWSVNDAATAKLMELFYKNLSEGMYKDRALQQAKLEFLETAGPAQANPFFWGSFVVMGNVEPIQMVGSSWISYWGYFVVVLGFVVLGWWFWRKRALMSSVR